jgi:hypothetical protein
VEDNDAQDFTNVALDTMTDYANKLNVETQKVKQKDGERVDIWRGSNVLLLFDLDCQCDGFYGYQDRSDG